MSKKHKNNNYRSVYKEHYGEIPNGYHIHHIDGNPHNNTPENLIAVTPEEHVKLHEDEFVRWASKGGKIGGQKCVDEGLGWAGWNFEQRSENSKNIIYTEEIRKKFSKLRKEEYRSGKRKHWTSFYDDEVVSEKIKEGDPGKAMRGKTPWNKGKKMKLSNPELATERKSKAALHRKKYPCDICGRMFDRGNLTKHSRVCG